MKTTQQVQQNITLFHESLVRVKDHPMCARFEDSGSRYTIYYPEGMYPNGCTSSYNGVGKAATLNRLFDVMERHWRSNCVS